MKVDIEKKEDMKKREGTKLKIEMKSEENNDKPDYEVYNFEDSGIGDSWMIGDESGKHAYIDGMDACPVNLIVPRSLESKEGVKKLVEVVGVQAYSNCGGYPDRENNTKSVLVTKQVKVIKLLGFGDMWFVESFRIEEGSVLERIEDSGIYAIGVNSVANGAAKRMTLTLPSTLSYVDSNGIQHCHLFNTIIYCGIHPLTNTCEITHPQNSVIEKTKVKVTDKYPADKIFNHTALRDSPIEVEVEKECKFMEEGRNGKDCICSTPKRIISLVLGFVSILLSNGKGSEYESTILSSKDVGCENEEHEEIVLIRRKTMKRMKRMKMLKRDRSRVIKDQKVNYYQIRSTGVSKLSQQIFNK